MADLGTPLSEPPGDGITALAFVPASDDLLVASSWDGTLRLYSTESMVQRQCLSIGVPILSTSPSSKQLCFSAALDGKIRRHDWSSGSSLVVGVHNEPARCVLWLPQQGLVASAGWDSRLCLWDATAQDAPVEDQENQPEAAPRPLKQFALPGKAYSMCLSGQRLAVATSERHLLIFNLAGLNLADENSSLSPEQLRESPLKHQTRIVEGYPDGSGFAAGSIEGKVAMEYFDNGLDKSAQKKAFIFKCHREKEAFTKCDKILYAVNALAFHPRFGTFATGGGDGRVFFWDAESKSRLQSLRGSYPTSVSALAFSASGTKLAIAASYAFEKGDIEHPADAIFIRAIGDEEMLPRSKIVK